VTVRRIVEGDDYSVLPVPMGQMMRALRRRFGNAEPVDEQVVGSEADGEGEDRVRP
jgi:hypothetical protein